MDFSNALYALKQGKRVQRKGWNGAGLFAFMRPSDELTRTVLVNNVKSLPKSVKDYYDTPSEKSKETIKFTSYLCIKTIDEDIANGWIPSQTDLMAEDWVILD